MSLALVLPAFALCAAAPEQPDSGPPLAERSGSCRGSLAPKLAAAPEGPLLATVGPADVESGRRACPRSELALGLRGGIVKDMPNFYGYAHADLLLSGSYAWNPKTELFASLEAVHLHHVENATLTGNSLSVGQTSVGATRLLHVGERSAAGPSARLLLPTSFESPRIRTTGLEVGAVGALRPSEKFEVHAATFIDGSVGLSAAAPAPRGGVFASAGMEYLFFPWLGLAGELNIHLGHRGPLDYLSPAVALRAGIGSRTGLELAFSRPIAGRDHHEELVSLRVSAGL